jgi:alpha-L-rhamnosidase
MYRVMVGLDTQEDGVGYKHAKIKPHIGGDFTEAAASLQTYYGPLSNSWKVDGNNIAMEVQIPANTKATVYMPAAGTAAVQEGGIALSSVKDIKVMGTEAGYVVLQLGSGTYNFSATQAASATSNLNVKDYIGKYTVTGGMISSINIKTEGTRLLVEVYNNSGELEPVKGKKDTFQSADGSTVTFMRNGKGEVVKVAMKALGMSFQGTKL